MKFLVTGHKGFIGSHFVKRLDSYDGYDLVDGRDLKTIKFFPDCDVVVHLAATNGTDLFYTHPTDVSFNNTLPTFNLVNWYRDKDVKFVYASTCEIFNHTDQIPTTESVDISFKDILNPRWSYSLPKALGENLVANCGLRYLIIRYFNIYGPNQKLHFINEFVERALKGDYWIIGNETRSFCYIDDAIEMTHRLINTVDNQIVNVGNPVETTIEFVAKTILNILEIDPERLEIRPGRVGSALRRLPDTKKVQSLTGFNTYTPLETGLKQTIESLL